MVTREVCAESADDLLRLKLDLRDWAAARLTELRPPIGLFHAVFATLEEDDEPGWVFASMYLAWQEHREIEVAR